MESLEQPEVRERPVAVRVAEPEDAEAIGRIQDETWLATYPNEAHGITAEDVRQKIEARGPTGADRWRKTIEDESGLMRVWVAKQDDEVVGFLMAKKGDQEHKVQAIYILPGQQGRGVGSVLMHEAFSWFSPDQPVSLGVAKYNESAIAFYKKMGFEEAGDVPPSPAARLPSGKEIPEIKMVRRTKADEGPTRS